MMTQLSNEDDLASFSHAFIILARAKPANALPSLRTPFLRRSETFLIKHRGINADTLLKWTETNPGWADDLKDTARDPVSFERVVETMAEAEGDTLCIIEAMKILNEIEADKTGTVTRILGENGQAVEYGQPLFVIRVMDGEVSSKIQSSQLRPSQLLAMFCPSFLTAK